MLPDFAAVLIVVAAAFVRATFGFGDALLAMPLLALTIGLGAATPLVGLVSFSTAVIMLLLSWRAVDVRAVLPFLVLAAVGIPLGVVFLKRAPSAWSLGALGVFLIGFGVYRLLSPRLPDIKHPVLTFLLGLLSGLFGGAYNTSGPFAVLYGSLRGLAAGDVSREFAGLLYRDLGAYSRLAGLGRFVDGACLEALRILLAPNHRRHHDGQHPRKAPVARAL